MKTIFLLSFFLLFTTVELLSFPFVNVRNGDKADREISKNSEEGEIPAAPSKVKRCEYDLITGQINCVFCTECSPNEYMLLHCTSQMDAVCAPCSFGWNRMTPKNRDFLVKCAGSAEVDDSDEDSDLPEDKSMFILQNRQLEIAERAQEFDGENVAISSVEIIEDFSDPNDEIKRPALIGAGTKEFRRVLVRFDETQEEEDEKEVSIEEDAENFDDDEDEEDDDEEEDYKFDQYLQKYIKDKAEDLKNMRLAHSQFRMVEVETEESKEVDEDIDAIVGTMFDSREAPEEAMEWGLVAFIIGAVAVIFFLIFLCLHFVCPFQKKVMQIPVLEDMHRELINEAVVRLNGKKVIVRLPEEEYV